MTDEQFMKRAVDLARRGMGTVSPNPMVGCVIVHEELIIGEGYHRYYGGPHAEVNAIGSVVGSPEVLRESTVYVTLEPCAHFGKTPPCADLLVRHGVKRVVVACRDPFPEVDGRGIEKLKQANITVDVGVQEHEARELNRRFFLFHEERRPYVILKWAQTADGWIARENYDSKWISNVYSRQLVHKWRTEEDAVLVGKNTVRYDDPALTVRDWTGRNPMRVILDRKLELPEDLKVLDGKAETIIFNERKDEVRGKNRWIRVDAFDPNTLLEKLYELGVQSIIVEGGAAILNAFVRDDCWDEARVFTSPAVFEKGIPAPDIDGRIVEKVRVFTDNLTRIIRD